MYTSQAADGSQQHHTPNPAGQPPAAPPPTQTPSETRSNMSTGLRAPSCFVVDLLAVDIVEPSNTDQATKHHPESCKPDDTLQQQRQQRGKQSRQGQMGTLCGAPGLVPLKSVVMAYGGK